ncbi:hypothetical protein HL653_17990 [Sphingomonas sp. AP4-R1]|uniref:hypothetical protein n=1 Tax=Sphingomonas sp. AP4-R1 TaxID=2735134 RepID=UPI00149357BC|nr:hypothetical protein [Sphingomonas sp. AP4-R1]QJU59394.1 hypothetical protein HL653_17990 [Sphingomonas sp. AP4-R1]
MKTVATLIALGAMTAAAVPAMAQVNARQHNQQDRIYNGVRNGSLTPHEAAKLERQQGRIAHAEHRARVTGGMSPAERARLTARQNAASANIHHQKHDPQNN